MAVTFTSTYAGPVHFHGSTSDTDHPNYPEVCKLNDAIGTSIQTALTAGFGANGSTLKAAEDRLTLVEADVTTLSTSFIQRIPLTLTANGTWAAYTAFATACTVTAIGLITPTAFASVGGTILLSVLKSGTAGNTMLAAADYNLESPATVDARIALSLTATGADLAIAANGLVYIKIVSNNADATGPNAGGAALLITYTPTV
jgi:hypothetical protein